MGCDGWTGGPCGQTPGSKRPGSSGFLLILPQLDQEPLFRQFEPFAKGAVYPSQPGDKPDGTTDGWNTPEITRALATRPPVFVCMSDRSEPMNGSCATGSYALVQGSNGPTYGIDQVRVKHYNNGMFLYKTVRTDSDVRNGLSNTIFVGETIENHTDESANCWSIGCRHLDSLRSTDNPLNTQPGKGVVDRPLRLQGQRRVCQPAPERRAVRLRRRPRGVHRRHDRAARLPRAVDDLRRRDDFGRGLVSDGCRRHTPCAAAPHTACAGYNEHKPMSTMTHARPCRSSCC